MRKSTVVGFAVALSVTLVACGGSPDRAVQRDALTNGVCDETDLTNPSVCEGPWEYQQYQSPCYAYARNQACGVDHVDPRTCVRYDTCPDASFGIAGYQTVFSGKVQVSSLSDAGPLCIGGRLAGPGELSLTRGWLWQPDSGTFGCGGTEFCPTSWNGSAVFATGGPASICRLFAEEHKIELAKGYGSDVEVVRSTVVSSGLGRCSSPGVLFGPAGYRLVCDIELRDPIYNVRAEPPCSFTVYDCPTTTYRACRTAANGLDPDPRVCNPAAGATFYSQPGLSRTDLEKLAHSAAQDPAYPPSCTTADDVADARAKYARLSTTLANIDKGTYAGTGVDAAALTSKVVAKLELLLELHGDQLTPEQRSFIQGLYGSHPATVPSCGTRADVTGAGGAAGGIALCDRLAQAHVKQPSALASAPACVDVAAQVSSEVPQGTVDVYLSAAQRVVGKALEVLPATDAAGRRVAFSERLALIQRWYDAVKGLYGGADPKALLWKDASAVAGAMARGSYSSALDAFCGSPGCASAGLGLSIDAARLHALLASTLQADQEVLTAAFPATGATPVRGAPLSFIVANALRSASSRLAALAPLHDVACLTMDCFGTGRTTEISQTIALLGAVHDRARLDAALKRSGSVRGPWKDVFTAIAEKHDTLVGALADAEGIPTTATDLLGVIASRVEAPPGSSSLPLTAFSDVVVPALRLAARYAARGTFVADPGVLDAGLDRARLAEIRPLVTGQENGLTSELTRYRAARAALATSLVEELRGVRAQQSIAAAILRKLTELREDADDLAALRDSAASDQVQFASVAVAYESLLNQYQSTSDYSADPVPIAPISVSAFDTRYLGTAPERVTDATIHAPIPFEAGDLARFSVSGAWSPTCAIRQRGALGAPPYQYPVSFSGAEGTYTGPEGYSVTYSSGAYVAQSASHAHSVTDSVCHTLTDSVSASISTGFGRSQGAATSYGGAVSGVLSASESYASSSSHCVSTTDSTSEAQGGDERLGAAFSPGLRLANTPFPSAPAGSLLAVVMPRGEVELGRAIDVLALRPQLSFVIPQASDVYLVVNDQYGCGSSDGTLLVEGIRTRPTGTRLRVMGLAMGSALQKVRAEAAKHVSERRLLPATVALLKDLAQKELGAECTSAGLTDCRPSTYPRELLSFFELWVDAVVADAERQVLGANLLREMHLVTMDAKALNQDLERATYEGGLLKLIPTWTLQGLDADQLKAKAASLANATATALFPFIRIVYPETFDAVADDRYANGTDARMQALLTLDWTSDYDAAAEVFVDATARLRADFDRTVQSVSVAGPVDVAVAFVRPGASLDPVWQQADASRAAALWDAIDATTTAGIPRIATLRILPEDLYSSAGGNAVLTCTQAAPIVRTMGVFIARPSDAECDTFNTWDHVVPATLGEDPVRYPTRAGLESFRFRDSGGWLSPSVNVTCGTWEMARDRYTSSPARSRATAAGLSPFDDITVELSSFSSGYAYLDPSASALVVWFTVEPRSGSVVGVATCP